MKVIEETSHGEAGDVARLLKAGEFSFFEGSENCVIVKKRRGGIAAEFRETEDAHYANLIMPRLSRVAETR